MPVLVRLHTLNLQRAWKRCSLVHLLVHSLSRAPRTQPPAHTVPPLLGKTKVNEH